MATRTQNPIARAVSAVRGAARGMRAGASIGWQNPRTVGRKASQPKQVVLWPDWRNAQPQWVMHDLSNYIHDGFNVNAVIYSAIMFKVRTAYAAMLRAYTGTRDEPQLLPAGSELGQLLDRPNAWQSFAELQAEALVYFNLFGNCYVWYRRERGNEWPSWFVALRPDRVHHLYDKERAGSHLAGYVYVPEGMSVDEGLPMLPQDTMHVRLPNPGDPYAGMGKGLSPISPLAQSGDVDNAATSFLKLFFDQGTMPMGLLSVDVPLTDEIVAEAKERWLQAYGNWQQWIEPVILGQGAKYQRLGASFDELDLEKLDARNESRIVMPFGVKLTLIESRPALVNTTYSNLETDYRMFLTNTLIPELMMFEEEWRYYLRSPDGTQFAQYDFDQLPGYIDQQQMVADVADAWQRSAATRAEYRRAIGLPASEADNVYMIPFNMITIPAGQPAPAPQTEVGAVTSEDDGEKALDFRQVPALPAGGKAALSNDAKRSLGTQILQTAQAWEPKAAEAAREAFGNDRREILAIVNGAQKAAYRDKAAVAWGLVLFEVLDYLGMASKEMWRSTFAPVLAGVIGAQGEHLSATFGMQFAVANLLSQEWFGTYTLTFADPISATSEREISALFNAAMAEGWSVPQMQENLDVLFTQWIDGTAGTEMAAMTQEQLERLWFATNRLPPWRTEMIARTETIRASNAGAMGLYDDWGVERREWLATMDGRTRDTHAAANGQVRAKGEAFDIGGSPMMYPGDPSGPPEEFINCRCTVIPVIEPV